MDPIYYSQPTCTEFEATVVEALEHEGRPAAVLDTTAFYPTSGGQPFDTGTLGDAHVVDVVEADDGRILHVLDRGVAAGSRVRGVIDWARRFDHMQQHTGQHILSAAFDRLHAARTVGFHLGSDVSSVDLAIPLSPEQIASAEEEANRAVWEDRPVSIRFVDADEAAKLPLRKEPPRGGTLRVIEVHGFDMSACGGTHVARAGEVGLIAVLSSERLRGGTRLEFVCGGRALRSFRTLREAVAGCIHHVSVAPAELPAAIERLQAQGKDQQKEIKDLQSRLAGFEAKALAGDAEEVDGVRRVVAAIEGQDQNGLRAMAVSICAAPGFEVALFSTTEPAVAVIARSKDGQLDSGRVLRALIDRFGGRGGGRGDMAQGGGLAAPAATLTAAARELMKR